VWDAVPSVRDRESGNQVGRRGDLISRKFPGAAHGLIFSSGEEHVEWFLCGVDTGNEFLEIALRHRRAAGSGLRSATSPDMKKDG